jgi:hypothetical protein
MAAVRSEMLAWNTGPAGVAAGALEVRGAAVPGAGSVVVVVAAGSGRAGLPDVPPGDARGVPEAGGWLPAHPAAHRPSAAAAITTVADRVGQDVV